MFALLWCAAPARAAVWTDTDTLRGTHREAQSGWAVTGTGDFDADGLPDFAVSAHFENVGVDTAAGAVRLIPGGYPPGTVSPLLLTGRGPHEHFGESLAGGADVSGDGWPDLVVGAPLRDQGALTAAGGVDVFLGGPGAPNTRWVGLTGEAKDDWFGQSVAVGDVNGDGVADIIVGAPFSDRKAASAGAAFIYLGGATPPLTPWKVLLGEAANDQFGWSVACLGDMDGDGFGDVAVGARLHSVTLKLAAGRVYLYRGGTAMDAIADGSWTGEVANDWFGHAIAAPGDVDGGGRPDLLVGAPFNDRGGSASGAAYLFRGEVAPGSAPAAIYSGESANAQFGWAVGAAGDVDGDGRPDLAVGAHFQSSGVHTSAGRAYLFAGGAVLSTTPRSTADGENTDDWLGQSVGGAPGFFHPGQSAFLTGAPLVDELGASSGRAHALGESPTLGVPLPASAAMMRAWPVPSRGQVELALPTEFTAPAEVRVSDVAGREIARWPLAPGVARVMRWDGRDRSGRSAPAGLYLMRVLEPGAASTLRASARVVLVR